MALKFSNKNKPKESQKQSNDSMAEEVQAYIDLGRKIDDVMDSISADVKEQGALKKKILKAMDTHDADQKVILEGFDDTLEGSMKSNKSTLTGDKKVILNVLGEDLFIKISKFNITDLKSYVDENDLEKIITTERTGARKLKVK